MRLRIYPDLPLPRLLRDPFWYSGRMWQRNDDFLERPERKLFDREPTKKPQNGKT
jgi:hypothetical protein